MKKQHKKIKLKIKTKNKIKKAQFLNRSWAEENSAMWLENDNDQSFIATIK
ncbi:hypothetical protein [Acinetobacter larvae]|uniref:hypothetical protein n=1 Tax=Acinetobacter larvae TaxID=1789224 RepID=UPI0012FDFA7E|nr:hypothetical protein [Acinetobacter larvae]